VRQLVFFENANLTFLQNFLFLDGIEPPQLAYQASTLPLSYRFAFVVQLDRILDCGSKDEGSNPSKGILTLKNFPLI
jgi:hypothetical protein